MPTISVIMTVFNGKDFLEEAIVSICNQTFTDWEFIIINEYGSNDGSRDIIEHYANLDSRIYFVQNERRLGFTASLNKGITMASGTYIARMDDDDYSYPTRFEKQVLFLENNADIGLCGTLQMSVKPGAENILYVATSQEDLKAEMLFGCQISHCSVMFRRKLFLENNYKYDENYLAEDYELWTRLLNKVRFANLGEVLVKHRWGFQNISIEKGERLHKENRMIIKRTINKLLHIDVEKYDELLFSTWRNDFKLPESKKMEFFLQNIRLLLEIEEANDVYKVIDPMSLAKMLLKRWECINSKIKMSGILPISKEKAIITLDKQIRKFKDNFIESLMFQNIIAFKQATNEQIINGIQSYFYLGKNKKVIIYGIGFQCKEFLEMYTHEYKNYTNEIIAYCDSDEKKWNTIIFDKNIIRPEDINNLNTDYIIIASSKYFYEIREQLSSKYYLSNKVFKPLYALYYSELINMQ
jgi:glycosyltransferase involved in cell wall biosynthesis